MMTRDPDRNAGTAAFTALAAATIIGIGGLLLEHSRDGQRAAFLWFIIPVTIGGIINIVERTSHPEKTNAYRLSVGADIVVTSFIAALALSFSFAPTLVARFPATALGTAIIITVAVALIYSLGFKTIERRVSR